MGISSYPQLLGSSSLHKMHVGEYSSANRLKVSQPETVFFNTFQYSKETDVWDEAVTTGGSATHELATSSVRLTVDSTLDAEVIRQTRNAQRYSPGRPAVLTFAVRLETPVAGIRRRFGLFNGEDGCYFEDNGGVYSCNITSTVSGTQVIQSVSRDDWNGDKLDGTGPSGITANPTAIQVIAIEYEWYGAGEVIFKYVINGVSHVVHTFRTANVSDEPWCRSPFLPIRYEFKNTTGAAGTHYLWQGSNSLISDGSTQKLGIAQNILSPITGTTLATANTFYPVLSVRLKAAALQGIVIPTNFQAATLDNTGIFFRLIRNPTLTGASWTDMPDANAFTQYDVSATAYTGGVSLFSGYIPSTSGGVVNKLDADTIYQLGRGSLGTVSDILTLIIAATGSNKDGVGSLTWIEQR